VRWKIFLATAGAAAAAIAAAARPSAAGSAAGQVWPAFVLVAGLLLVGLVAADDGVFAWAGDRLARTGDGPGRLLVASAALVAVVAATLNLDTAVAFVGPVLVHTSRRRGLDEGRLLALCVLGANAGSLLLPGSNLTNLIVLGSHSAGSVFARRMALPWVLAIAVTVAAVAVFFPAAAPARPEPREPDGPARITGAAGPVAVVLVVVAVLALGNPAPVAAAIGVVAAGWKAARGGLSRRRMLRTVDLPVLAGLFGLAVALGTLGRVWSGPSRLSSHLDSPATAAVGAVVSVLVNNLPAAAVLSSRPPPHPLSLLIGLDVGPNLFVSGSLAWVLWLGATRAAGGRPALWRTVVAGAASAPVAMAAGVAALALVGPHS
jgi:arsenical pump membrane protein